MVGRRIARRATRRLPLLALAGALAAVAGLGGCGDDAPDEPGGDDGVGDLSVELDTTAVDPGERIQARVRNDSDETFTYGAGYELEREVDGDFEPVELPRRPVPQIGYLAEPGQSGPPVTVEVPGDAEPGRWRVLLARNVPGVGDLGAEFVVGGG
jgi:hypothetical protein